MTSQIGRGDDAKEEVSELHEVVEGMREQNKKWRLNSRIWQAISVGLGLLSVVLGAI